MAPALEGEAPPESPLSTVWVDRLVLSGNHVIPDDVLTAAALPFLGRHLTPHELQALVAALTRVYVDAGYANSGAVLRDQHVRDGSLAIEIIEGRLGAIDVEGAHHYRAATLVARLTHAIGAPLRVQDVEDALRVLESDRRIRRLDARLRPTDVRGVARLEVRVEEALPFRFSVGVDNYEPPSVGTLAARAAAGYDDLLGVGDTLWLDSTVTEGLWRLAGGYEIPVHPSGTLLGIDGRVSRGRIVQPPFDEIDVESTAFSVSAGVKQPLLRHADHELWVGLGIEHEQGQTSLLGRGFTFAPGPDDGRASVTTLQPLIDWSLRRSRYGLALRSLFAIGLDLPWTTQHGDGDIPDGSFFAWLGQARGIYRDPASRIAIQGRLDVQLTDRPLLPLQQATVGGPYTVRGYPRNYLVRDQAIVGSVELTYPVWTRSLGDTTVELAAFGDVGRAWNRDRVTPGKRTISSAGLGIHVYPMPGMSLDAEYAWPIRDVDAGDSLQARGLLLAARWSVP